MRLNYYERHIGDYVRDTAHLTMLEHGAYTLLMDRYYATEAGIPADQAHRLARARTREEKSAVDAVLQEFFTLVDGVWTKNRIQEEITKAQAKINAAKENGRKGGRPRKPKKDGFIETDQKPSGLSAGSETETQQKAHQAPDTRHQLTPSTQQAASTTQPEGAPASPSAAPPDPVSDRALQFVLLLRERGAALQCGDPRVRGWAERGITDAQALQALEIAQQRRSDAADPTPINAGYLDAILRDTGTTPASRSPPGRMTREDSRRIAAGTRLPEFRAACAAEQEHSDDDGRTIEGNATRLLG
jgi:uncharacterized protein YdaU (DUF1376 family)